MTFTSSESDDNYLSKIIIIRNYINRISSHVFFYPTHSHLYRVINHHANIISTAPDRIAIVMFADEIEFFVK